MKNSIKYSIIGLAGAAMLAAGCSRSFLDADPLSFYEPNATFTSESGIRSVLAILDRQMKRYWSDGDHNEMLPLMSEYTMSDLMVPAATDKANMLDNVAQMLTPNSDQSTLLHLDRQSTIWFMWQQQHESIRNANTILSYIDNVKTLDEATRNKYKGMALFHRAFRYYNLVFQFGDLPLQTKLLDTPKLNFKSTKRDAILQMLREDLEFAVQWVPEQKDMSEIGSPNKGGCRMLLSKVYLALGEYAKAKEVLDVIINQSGYSLMTENFGTFINNYECPEAWPITRNVIWDLHRPENALIAANKETIMGLPNQGAAAESFIKNHTMRCLYPFYFNNMVKMPDGKQALLNIKRNQSNYDVNYDYMRAMGRGIATIRPTGYYQYTLWNVNGKSDATDLRHSVETGNWLPMEAFKCNNVASEYFGQNLRLHDEAGKLLCEDTIRRWYAVPHYIWKLGDPEREANVSGSDGHRGASDGGNGDYVLYRLAEAYLLRAEARFYVNPSDPAIADDINIIRKRAKCTELYASGKVTIGDIMDERARELFWEEFRNVELKRVSLCLARSGKPDEWGNTYKLETFDKQEGTDATGGSYWYQRVTKCGMYNHGTITVNATKTNINYVMDKKNMYWPIPEKEITANYRGQIHQNYGYTGYDENCPEFDDWKDAAADMDKVN
ncbi:MAG: RagB/SusD family nutrient uptake outer membrane protein [Bacteroidales bacterium]|nr:RagB/SusD family nutrient uptake outer membrane protein [Bacteroidales bacterium]